LLESIESTDTHGEVSVLSYEYDGGLLLSESSNSFNSKLEFDYDEYLRAKSMKLTLGQTQNLLIHYSYNDEVSDSNVTQGLYPKPAKLYNQLISAGDMSYIYDENGFLSETRMSSGGETPFSETYAYNNYGEITSITNNKHDFSYTYDGIGRIKTITSGTEKSEYFYDQMDRIEYVEVDGVETERYTYDDNGNRITAIMIYKIEC
jgi:YD repeat-containing protein